MILINKRECLNVGSVLIFRLPNLGTLLIFRIHNVGTVPTFEMDNLGAPWFYDSFLKCLNDFSLSYNSWKDTMTSFVVIIKQMYYSAVL